MLRKIISVSLLLCLIAAVSLGVGCNIADNGQEVVLSVNIGSEPESIDPAHNEAVDGATLIIHAFEGLYSLDKDGVPVLAQAKSASISADKLVYTLTLRDDIKWSDGKKVTAEDFIYAWKRAVDPKTAAPYAYMLDVIKNVPDIMAGKKTVDQIGAIAKDEKTIEITLAAPCPYFNELLAFPTYLPVRKDIVDANPDKWATKAETYITNGPYKLTSWVSDSEMIYEKNANYYNVKKLGPDKIKFVLMDDDNAILAAYQTNQIMFADTIANNEIDNWKAKPDFNKIGQLGTYFVCFNTKKAPFDNVKVRQAMSLVIDRNYIVEKIGKAGQVPASAFVPIGLTGTDPKKAEFREEGGDYYSVKAEEYAANVTKAKALLAEAGYPDGKGFPKFEYLYNTSSGHKLIGEALQNMWKEKLGIECTLQSQDWSVFLQSRQDGNYQVARHGWLGDYNDPISFIDMWATGGGNNDADWSNAQYDQLVKDIKATDVRTTRYTKMHAAEKILMDEMPIAPIYYYVDIFLKNPKLEGFYSSPLGFKYFMYTSIKE